ncbi:MAG: hypothetical protein DMF70_15335, partial [Acidobacteria bacterium]
MNGPCLKSIPIWNGPVNTGNAGALARSEREARNSYGVRKLEIERAAHASAGEGARAPSISLSLPVTLFGQARMSVHYL